MAATDVDSMHLRARAHLDESAKVLQATAKTAGSAILAASHLIAAAFSGGHKLLLCGNGGSAADAQHIAAEFVSRLSKEFERPGLPAIALTTDTSFLTGYANDYDFSGIFERQVQALGGKGDVLIGISTSGASRNVVRAVALAKDAGLATIALMGESGALADLADVVIRIPAVDTQYVQEALLAVEHIICDQVEWLLYPTRPFPR